MTTHFRPSSQKGNKFKKNLQIYVFLCIGWQLAGCIKMFQTKIFQFLQLSLASLSIKSNVQGRCGNSLNIKVEGKYQQRGEIL
jgi:hypothetical protein